MNSEISYTYETEIEVAFFNENKIVKPYAYQNLFAQVADKHLNNYNLNVDTTMKYNLAWALVSLSVEIVNPITNCMDVYASTWHSAKVGPYFRREYLFKDKNGNTLFHGSSFSVLLDVVNRSVYRKKEYPFEIHEPIPEFTIDASPSFKTQLDYEKVDSRIVKNSYLDCLGHVNNCRYSEFAYDTFTDNEVQNLDKIKRIDIYFHSELRNKDNFSILKTYSDDKMFIRGENNTKGDKSFDIIFSY